MLICESCGKNTDGDLMVENQCVDCALLDALDGGSLTMLTEETKRKIEEKARPRQQRQRKAKRWPPGAKYKNKRTCWLCGYKLEDTVVDIHHWRCWREAGYPLPRERN